MLLADKICSPRIELPRRARRPPRRPDHLLGGLAAALRRGREYLHRPVVGGGAELWEPARGVCGRRERAGEREGWEGLYRGGL